MTPSDIHPLALELCIKKQLYNHYELKIILASNLQSVHMLVCSYGGGWNSPGSLTNPIIKY